MSMTDSILRFRHILYRLKERHLYGSRWHTRLRNRIWPVEAPGNRLETILSQSVDCFKDFDDDYITDPAARTLITRETKKWRFHPDVIQVARGPIIIEPKWGLAYFKDRSLIELTRGSAHKTLVPPRKSFVRSLSGRQERADFQSVIHFDGFLGKNLFHLFADAIQPYMLMRDSGFVDMSQPTIIGKIVFDKPYFKTLMALPLLRDVDWVVTDQSSHLVCSQLTTASASFAWFKNSYELLAPLVTKNPHRRIFLDRDPRYQRRMTNSDEAIAMIRDHSFEVHRAEDMTYLEQLQLFAEASHIIALHGAGLTNILASDLGKLRVLELTSLDLIQPHFYWLRNTITKGYHDILSGSKFDINWNFEIDLEALGLRIKSLLGV